MFDASDFANAIKRSRLERGLTQAELADGLGVSPQSISRWECGLAMPDLAHLTELSGILGVSLDSLLMGHGRGTKTLIGVDAGGTKSEFVLIDETGTVLNRVLLDGCNPNVVGIDEVIRIAKRGIVLLRPREMNTAGIYFGGAGLVSSNFAEVLNHALKKTFPGIRVHCGSDATNVVSCASDPDRCVAAISGTGCVAFASLHGKITRLGGIGYLFEKAGGGFEIGRDAVSAALKDRDGIGEKTLLRELVEKKLAGDVWSKIQDFYKRDISYVASFAPLVSMAADAGDAVALAILRENSAHVAELIRSALKLTGKDAPVILSGSVFIRTNPFDK